MTGRLTYGIVLLLTAIVLTPLLMQAGAIPTPVRAIPEPVLSGEIADGEYVLTQPLIVPAGTTLTIRNATVWLDYISDCSWKIGDTADDCTAAITVAGGRLRIIDSVIDTHNWNYQGSYWRRPWFIQGHAGILEATGSTFVNMRFMDFEEPGTEPSILRDNVFTQARAGLSFTRGADAIIEGNLFNNSFGGLRLIDSDSLVRNNVFRNIASTAISVEESQVGEKFLTSGSVIENNLIEHVGLGILNLNGFASTLRGNTVRDSRTAVSIGITVGETDVHGAGPLVTGNTFTNLENGVVLYVTGTVSTTDVAHAAFHGNSITNIGCSPINVHGRDHVDFTIDATLNWWGSADGPQGNGPDCPAVNFWAGTATVTYDPWLTAAPEA